MRKMDRKSWLTGFALGLCGKPLPIGGGEPVIPDDESGNYLTFASAEPFTIGVNNATKNWDGVLEYSTDTAVWTEWDGAAAIASAEHGGEQKIYMRGSGNTVICGSTEKARWVPNGTNIRCEGNIENLLDYKTVANGEHPIMADYCYQYMFHNWGSALAGNSGNLIQAPELPATTLSRYCYSHMFDDCTELTVAPELPATALARDCYSHMFFDCFSLIQAPELPATTLATNCYYGMFRGCDSLTQLPELPATTLPGGCYAWMFAYCDSLKLSETESDEYATPYSIPISGTGTGETDSLLAMFFDTGGTFTGSPDINTTYYTANEVV